MNHCGIQQNGNFSPLVCPKPRRLSLFNTSMNEPVRPLRWQMCYQQESYDSKSGPELLDLILTKGGGYGSSTDQTCTQVASSPPFFCGSPPSRVSNPLIQDARFGDEKITPILPRSMIPNRIRVLLNPRRRLRRPAKRDVFALVMVTNLRLELRDLIVLIGITVAIAASLLWLKQNILSLSNRQVNRTKKYN